MVCMISILVGSLLCAGALAVPNSARSLRKQHQIAKRDNDWHLKCSNAPDTIGGYFLDPASVPPMPQSLTETGSDQDSMRYMWCTPGTKTYTFFGARYLTPPPLDYMNFPVALNETGSSYSNQADVDVPDGGFTVDPAGTNVQIHMENSGGGKLTWGIVNSALAGLWQFLSVYGTASQNQNPLVFQVNDGAWGEVGIGYAAFLRPSDGKCLLQIWQGDEMECKDLTKVIN
ncbi:hypothetical protein ACLMJK_001082 [Lecanora helva]